MSMSQPVESWLSYQYAWEATPGFLLAMWETQVEVSGSRLQDGPGPAAGAAWVVTSE